MEKSFCKDCRHRGIDSKMKTIFNENVQETFMICPIETSDNIAGCFIKSMEIDWKRFKTFCEEKGLLNGSS